MTNRTNHVPEPEQQPKEENETPQVDLPAWSSEEDSADEELEAAANGYQPLNLSANDGGVSEFHPEPLSSSEDDGEETPAASSQEQKREITFNPDLVLSTMRSITIPGSSIPPWAKEMSDAEWKEVVQRTMKGESTDAAADTDSSEPPEDVAKS